MANYPGLNIKDFSEAIDSIDDNLLPESAL